MAKSHYSDYADSAHFSPSSLTFLASPNLTSRRTFVPDFAITTDGTSSPATFDFLG